MIILTSHSQLGNTGRKTGFWFEEFATPYYIFKNSGAELTLASPNGGLPPVDPRSERPEMQTEAAIRFQADGYAQAELANTRTLSSISVGDYDVAFYPGGHGLLWDLANDLALALHQGREWRPLVTGKIVTGLPTPRRPRWS